MHILKSSPSPTSLGFSWTKAGREKGHDLVKSMRVHSPLLLVYSLNQFMKPLTSGELKTTGTSFLLQCTQNTLQPFCCLSLVCHLLLSPPHGTSASQSTLNYFVFPCSTPSLMSAIIDVSSALFHLSLFLFSRLKHTGLDSWSSYGTRKLPGCHNRKYWHIRQRTTESWYKTHDWALHLWETRSNELKQGTGKAAASQEGLWLLLHQDVQECRLRLGGWSPAPDPHLQYQSAQFMSASLSTWLLVSGREEVLAVELGLWVSRTLTCHSMQVSISQGTTLAVIMQEAGEMLCTLPHGAADHFPFSAPKISQQRWTPSVCFLLPIAWVRLQDMKATFHPA